jgi:hypothetical protein
LSSKASIHHSETILGESSLAAFVFFGFFFSRFGAFLFPMPE